MDKLLKELEDFVPFNEQEKYDKELIIRTLRSFENVSDDYNQGKLGNIFTRENTLAHMTASNWIVNEKMDKVLMCYHNIYQSYSWTGGHADAEVDMAAVALREAKEETGVQDIKIISKGIYAVAVLPVNAYHKNGKYVSNHLHLDVCYLLQCSEKSELVICQGENSDLKWIDIDKVNDYVNEELMKPNYQKLNDKLVEYKK